VRNGLKGQWGGLKSPRERGALETTTKKMETRESDQGGRRLGLGEAIIKEKTIKGIEIRERQRITKEAARCSKGLRGGRERNFRNGPKRNLNETKAVRGQGAGVLGRGERQGHAACPLRGELGEGFLGENHSRRGRLTKSCCCRTS